MTDVTRRLLESSRLLETVFEQGGPRRDPHRTLSQEAELCERYMPGHPVADRLVAAAAKEPDRLLSDFYREHGLFVDEEAAK